MYEDEFELTFDTPEEEPVYEPEKASAAPAPVPETTPAEIVPDEPTRVLEPRRAAPAEPAEPTPVSEPEPAEEPQPQSAAVPVIETDMMAAFTAEDKAALAEETPVGRLGTADEVAKLLVFLAGEDAGYITGQVFGVNGGLVI